MYTIKCTIEGQTSRKVRGREGGRVREGGRQLISMKGRKMLSLGYPYFVLDNFCSTSSLTVHTAHVHFTFSIIYFPWKLPLFPELFGPIYVNNVVYRASILARA